MNLTRQRAANDAFAHLRQICPFADDGLRVLDKLVHYYAKGYGAQDPVQILAILATEACEARRVLEEFLPSGRKTLDLMCEQLENRCATEEPLDIVPATPFASLAVRTSQIGGKPITSLDMLRDLLSSYGQFESRMMASLFLERNGVRVRDLFRHLQEQCGPVWEPPSVVEHTANRQGSFAETAYQCYTRTVLDHPAMRALYNREFPHGSAVVTNKDGLSLFQETLDELTGLARDALKPDQKRTILPDVVGEAFTAAFTNVASIYVGVHYDPMWKAWVAPEDGGHLVLLSSGYCFGTFSMAILYSHTLVSKKGEDESATFKAAGEVVGWVTGLLPGCPSLQLATVGRAGRGSGAGAKCLFDASTLFIICHELAHLLAPFARTDMAARRRGELLADASATTLYARAQELLVEKRKSEVGAWNDKLTSLVKYGPKWLMGLMNVIAPKGDESASTHPSVGRRQKWSDEFFRTTFGQADSPVNVAWPWCDEFWRLVGVEVDKLRAQYA